MRSETLELTDGRTIRIQNGNEIIYNQLGMNPIHFFCHQLKTGKLFFDLKIFNGFMFVDNNHNFYDAVNKIIYFNYGEIFVGDKDKEAFCLFDNYNLMENKIKEKINSMSQEPNENRQNDIQNNICEELKEKLDNFDFKKISIKNGKYICPNSNYLYIHDNNIIECYENNEKLYESEFIQEIEDNKIILKLHGIIKIYFGEYSESEMFYNCPTGRYKKTGDENEKFGFFTFDNNDLEVVERKEKSIIYKIIDKRITLEKMNDVNIPVRILIKDKDNKNIIYEINVKMSEENELIGNGLVKDYRTGEILLVNFNTENIISNNILNDFPLFQDKNEYNMYQNNTIPQKESIIKNDILKINSIISDENKIEEIAEEINKEITKEKIKTLGIKNQGYLGECWVYSLSLLICMANARKFGRKIEDFNSIYNYIIEKYNKNGKTFEEMVVIMNEVLGMYNLKYEIINDEYILKDYIKRGIKCLATLNLNKLEWYNFSNFSNDFKEGKVLTKELLQQQNIINIQDPNQTDGHSVILSDIDEEDNYILINSWGKDWGNNGTFKIKKECLESKFFAVYYLIDQLTNDENNSWNKLKENIKKSLKEMKSILCPMCKRRAKIEQFDIIDKLKCPYETNCVFDINKDISTSFYVSQLLSYDNYTNMDFKQKFNYGFG